MIAKIAIGEAEHQTVANAIHSVGSARLRHATARRGAQQRKACGGRTREEGKRRVRRRDKVDVEMKDAIRAGAGKFHERCRGADWWQNHAIEVAGKVDIFVRSAGNSRADESGRETKEHIGSIERERLRAQKGRA